METNTQVNEELESEEGLSIKDIIAIIRKHLIAIIIFVVVGTGCGFAAAKVKDYLSPEYTTYATMMVSKEDESSASTSTYQYSNYIASTFVEFIQDDVIIDQVAANHEDLTSKTIKANLSVTYTTSSLIITLNYTASDMQETVDILTDIVNTTIKVANSVDSDDEPVHKLLYKNISTLTMPSLDKVTKVGSTMKYTLIGFAAGAVIAAAYVVIKEMLDNTFKNKDEVEKLLGTPILGIIPLYEFKEEDNKADASGKGGNK